MEEIICPHCGKPNSSNNKICDYCLGQLKPSDINADREDQSGMESDENGLDWLRSLSGDELPESKGSIDLGEGLATPTEMVSDWLAEERDEDSETVEADEYSTEGGARVQPFYPGDEVPEDEGLPDWLDDALLDKSEIDSDEYGSGLESDFERDEGELPKKESEATRPSQGRPDTLESAGPLAGLEGALSPEPGIVRPRKPAAYTTKLSATATQRAHVDLLTSLIADEGQARPLPEKGVISQQHVFRWVIAIVMLIVVSWPVLTGSQEMPFPPYEEVSAEVNRLVSQLGESSPVLIAFDFEPGLTAELEAATTPVMDHLMSQEALLTLVSISPSGPILAERFMGLMQEAHDYKNGDQYVNLGYIPGGAAGLASFFDNPQNTLPYTLDGLPAWENEDDQGLKPLAGIEEITDFEMVMVLIDDADAARSWIEQLSPRINEPDVLTSFVLITSAQIEPIVLPYYDSIPPQVNGLVAGLRGGAAYAQITGSGDLAREYWDAFGMGTFIAALLILIGGLGYYVIPELMRSPQVQGKGKK